MTGNVTVVTFGVPVLWLTTGVIAVPLMVTAMLLGVTVVLPSVNWTPNAFGVNPVAAGYGKTPVAPAAGQNAET